MWLFHDMDLALYSWIRDALYLCINLSNFLMFSELVCLFNFLAATGVSGTGKALTVELGS